VHKALSKLRHPSRIKKISVKRLLEDREQKLAVAGIEIDELYEQIDALTLNSPINPKIRYKVDFRKKSISEIGFSSRVYNHLLNAGISTIESLLTLDSLDILAQRRSFGKASKLEIVQKMRQNEYVEWADKMDGYAPLAK
jgi:DNA-directed RNA polymerase alpha subunit